ncbi:MAG: hypothetical protein MUE30_08745 [Spirosomaceae bacterium]|jgi:hypothetical protein|nr:hypothetical protein [Spirosomataceae bacterium]
MGLKPPLGVGGFAFYLKIAHIVPSFSFAIYMDHLPDLLGLPYTRLRWIDAGSFEFQDQIPSKN